MMINIWPLIHAFISALAAGLLMYLFVVGLDAHIAALLSSTVVFCGLMSIVIKLESIMERYLHRKHYEDLSLKGKSHEHREQHRYL